MVNMKKTLYRLPRQGKIFGVCAGLAEYFDIDVTLMRVIFVILAFATSGAMVLLYFILAVILPVYGDVKDDTISEKIEILGKDLQSSKSANRARNYTGAGIIIVGAWLLLGQFYPWMFNVQWQYIWPLLLILAGVLMITRRGHDK